MKKALLIIVIIMISAAFTAQMGWLEGFGVHPFFKPGASAPSKDSDYDFVTAGNVKYRVKAEGNSFYFYENGKWDKKFLKGVNIGAGKPGIFPGELTTGYEEYYRWFEMISKMNANCIRVYTTLRPQFYNALLDFNKQAKNPLYLLQGVWMNEEDIASLADVYAQNGKIVNEFTKDAKDIVDVLHGNITLPARAGFASGVYTADVSKYLAGIILGIEWDPKFVKNTNDNNAGQDSYDGKYLYTLSATPFEAFLCGVGDKVIEYQTEKYGFQSPVSFSNWVTTDPLKHVNEPHPDEDLIEVNMENIKSRSSFIPNQFASYHIYPYYPDSLNYQEDYLAYKDDEGKSNPYRAYLKDLKMAHTMPIIVAEFGVPTSRGMAHQSVMGYHQGNVDETAQGKMLLDMLHSMYEENYAGGLVFCWQDEWFKRTWNTVKFDIADKRPFWSNAQTNEQCFGILAFDPGSISSTCYVDGDVLDWQAQSPVTVNKAGKLYMKSDERYVYFMAELQSFDFDKDTLFIPVDTIQSQGNLKMNGTPLKFDKAADFVIRINGKENSRIVVDSYYDAFYYLYGEQYKMIPLVSNIRQKNSGRFNTMQMCYNYEMTIPPKGTVIPFKSFETGKLRFGNANPDAKDYSSLADFCYKNGKLEIKIPWQLFNVMDPSHLKIMDDFYSVQNISGTGTQGFSIGMAAVQGNSNQAQTVSLNGQFIWQEWTVPTYHERLKPSYYVLQKGFLDFS